MAGTLTRFQPLPGLPVSALALVCPLIAASILSYRASGFAGVAALLRRAFDFKRVVAKIWYAPTLLLMPGIMALSYITMRLFMGVPLPTPQFSLTSTLVLFVVFFVSAIGEELGWSGYAIDPLQRCYGALQGALVLGMMWAVWHFIPLLSVSRSPAWIAWWTLGTVASRVLITWLYNHTGRSVFIAVLFHAMINLTWQSFPINGSYYDPCVTGLIYAAVALIVVIGWKPETWVHAQTHSASPQNAVLAPTSRLK